MGSTINSSTEAIEAFIEGGEEQLVACSDGSAASESLTRGTGLELEPPSDLTSKFFSLANSILICSISLTAESNFFSISVDW